MESIFALEPGGNIKRYPGNYSIYLDYKKDELAAAEAPKATKSAAPVAPAIAPTPPTPAKTTTARKLSFKEKREHETLEAAIPKLEAEKASIEKQLSENQPTYSEVKTLSDRLVAIEKEIETSTDRWMELSEEG